ncbi:MAG: Phosphopantothenoylcysteine decarboxylase / Phosphopantothenoylcysteine synthetase [uncultured Rubrobacteraceae bacterium]|uniref:Phosphopantothenoylcysteine decarboxylase / Phosphopantothenoylcysteine synthetase n=1 Tax=uncultured Rubrobacteraceae bacterium TaxID=349277 RepID=A0A6J4R6M4_9ACTN|nr:MAG: Phosphopantothenoylcysteine decarboxylase / Phosphopantothenoylcysteine synthetase [uncultured Rubrobacteraceae bacterium]
MILVSVGPTAGALSAPAIARELAAAGHEVQVILEPNTERFVGPGAFAPPTGVVEAPSGVPKAVLFAPATSGTLSRLARGLEAGPAGASVGGGVPVFVAPDLDADTASNPAVRANLAALAADGRRVVVGVGEGMAGVGEVVAGVLGGMGGPMAGLRVLVTAGGTHEPLDSVRFIGNRSSGKMGLALAREALRLGAQVDVVAANVGTQEPGVGWSDVETVEQLRDEVVRLAGGADALVMAAAVSDFTPASPVREKIRRSHGVRSVELEPTPDVLKAVREKNPDLFVVGFAATHGDPVVDAREKLLSKGADIVVGNDISLQGLGFGAEENEVYVVARGGERFVPRASKAEVAREILNDVLTGLKEER